MPSGYANFCFFGKFIKTRKNDLVKKFIFRNFKNRHPRIFSTLAIYKTDLEIYKTKLEMKNFKFVFLYFLAISYYGLVLSYNFNINDPITLFAGFLFEIITFFWWIIYLATCQIKNIDPL